MKLRVIALLVASIVTGSLKASVIEWEFPRDTDCHEGLPFADGITGVLVWGGESEIRLTIGRADLWDHRGGYAWLPSQNYTNIVQLVQSGKKEELVSLFKNEVPENWGGRYNPYMLPLGRVIIKIAEATLERGELDTSTGLGKLILSNGQEILLAMSTKGHVFAMRFPKGLDYKVTTKNSMEFEVGKTLLNRGFKRAKNFDSVSSGGFKWDLPVDESVTLAWKKSEEDLAIATSRGDAEPKFVADYNQVKAESETYWSAFWEEGATIKVPDQVVQELFDFGMYKFGAMTEASGCAAGLQGAWLEDDRLVPWNGDYHFNINVQQCYSPAYRGGHLKNLMPLFKMVRTWWPRLRQNAKLFCGIDDGFVLPHSVDDRGVCIGGFWAGTIDHASTAWVASMMFKYVRYSGDIAFLRSDAYEFMQGAMNVYRAMMEERNGKLSIPIGPSPEWGASDVQHCVGRDPSFQLAAAHRLAKDLISAAEMLGEQPNPMWIDVDKRLPQYTYGEGGFQLFEGQPFVMSHRHHSHMAALYPFNTLDMSDKKTRKDVWETYINWVRKGTGEWSGWCVPWASILNTHVGQSDAAVHMLHSWKRFYTNGGNGSCHDAQKYGFTTMMGRKVMQMDGQCAAVTAIMEMMVHETGSSLDYFKGCPVAWKEVSFKNIRLANGKKISGKRVNGKVIVE